MIDPHFIGGAPFVVVLVMIVAMTIALIAAFFIAAFLLASAVQIPRALWWAVWEVRHARRIYGHMPTLRADLRYGWHVFWGELPRGPYSVTLTDVGSHGYWPWSEQRAFKK